MIFLDDLGEKEYFSLLKYKTWLVVHKPLDNSILDTKWIFKRKIDAKNDIQFKARLVARGGR